jgi:hypothetical protein
MTCFDYTDGSDQYILRRTKKKNTADHYAPADFFVGVSNYFGSSSISSFIYENDGLGRSVNPAG